MRRFNELTGYFKKYATQYDFDWLLLVAQGYQESQLDQTHAQSGGRDRRHAGDAHHGARQERRHSRTSISSSPTSMRA